MNTRNQSAVTGCNIILYNTINAQVKLVHGLLLTCLLPIAFISSFTKAKDKTSSVLCCLITDLIFNEEEE